MKWSAKAMAFVLLFVPIRIDAPAFGAYTQGVTKQTESTQNPCWQKAFTQLAMDQCAAQDFTDADAEMNRVYRQVLTKFVAEPDRVSLIRKAERAWIDFRDAEVEALYPRNEEAAHGTAWRMCRPIELTRLTQEHTKALRLILKGREGDVCSQ